MRMQAGRLLLTISSAVLALGASTATGTTIQDLVRIKGHEHNVLTGLGIVIGLDGTGDTAKRSLVAARPYAELLKNLGNAVTSLDELAKADAYAIVEVTMEIPPAGVREGDRLDVYVETLFNATSLRGGRLVVSPLRLPLPDSAALLPMAIARGAVVIGRSAARPYAELLKNLGNAVTSLDELAKADAYAIVEVTMEIPPAGVREGDRLDVYVETLFNATSLRGGRLVVSPLRLPLPDSAALLPMAIARGAVVIEGDNPRSGVVRGGGQMLSDIRTNPVTQAGTMGLVLKDSYAGYPIATTLAATINDEFALDGYAPVALVEDAKKIKVLLPAADRANPANFIAILMTIALDPSLIQTEARIVINEKQGIILITGNVEIAPVGITHKGLSITSITPLPVPTPAQPVYSTRRWAGLDTTGRQTRQATRLLDLLTTLDQLKVPVEDQIAVIYELKKTGAPHAQIVDK